MENIICLKYCDFKSINLLFKIIFIEYDAAVAKNFAQMQLDDDQYIREQPQPQKQLAFKDMVYSEDQDGEDEGEVEGDNEYFGSED